MEKLLTGLIDLSGFVLLYCLLQKHPNAKQ